MNIYTDSGDEVSSSRLFLKRHVRAPYERLRVSSVPVGESMTSQSDKDAADINSIIARFKRTGDLPLAREGGQSSDVTDLQSFQTSELIVRSRSTLDDLDSQLSAADAKTKQQEADRLKAEQAELARLRAAQPPATPPAT